MLFKVNTFSLSLILILFIQSTFSCNKSNLKGKKNDKNVNKCNPKLKVTTNNKFQLPIDLKSCSSNEKLFQLNQTISETFNLIDSGLNEFLNNYSNNSLIEKYFGNSTSISTKTDLILPIGIFERIKNGKKDEILIKCNGKKDEILIKCNGNKEICKIDKFKNQGGYIIKEEKSNSNSNSKSSLIIINICNKEMSKKISLIKICQNRWKLCSNQLTKYSSIAFLSLLMQIPQLSSSLLIQEDQSYSNVLELAKTNSIKSIHNTSTYLYFLLDSFSKKFNNKKGCIGRNISKLQKNNLDD